MLFLSPNARLSPTKAAVSSKLEKSLLEDFSDISLESSTKPFFLSNKFKNLYRLAELLKPKKQLPIQPMKHISHHLSFNYSSVITM